MDLICQTLAAVAVRSRVDKLVRYRYNLIGKTRRINFDFHLTGQVMDYNPDYSMDQDFTWNQHLSIVKLNKRYNYHMISIHICKYILLMMKTKYRK